MMWNEEETVCGRGPSSGSVSESLARKGCVWVVGVGEVREGAPAPARPHSRQGASKGPFITRGRAPEVPGAFPCLIS